MTEQRAKLNEGLDLLIAEEIRKIDPEEKGQDEKEGTKMRIEYKFELGEKELQSLFSLVERGIAAIEEVVKEERERRIKEIRRNRRRG